MTVFCKNLCTIKAAGGAEHGNKVQLCALKSITVSCLALGSANLLDRNAVRLFV